MNNKLILKGSIHGVKKYRNYKNPDIIDSNVDNHLCQINDFKITYLSNKNQFYIYHSYYALSDNVKNYTGRWYISDYTFKKNDLDETNKTFKIILESIDWEDFDTGNMSKKDVEVQIYLTPSGLNKLQKFFANHINEL